MAPERTLEELFLYFKKLKYEERQERILEKQKSKWLEDTLKAAIAFEERCILNPDERPIDEQDRSLYQKL